MKLSLNNRLVFLTISSFFLASLSCESQKLDSNTEQVADLTFKPTVKKPAYTNAHPKVLFDEAHNNYHTSSGRYKPFVDLISSDGYIITPRKRVHLTNNNNAEYSPSWSPDGDRIVFVSKRDGNLEIYVMNADGSEQMNVSKHPAWDQFPVWSPDGTQLLLVSDRDGDRDVYLMNADGSDVRNLSKDRYESFYLPTWSPDQTRITYAAVRTLERWEV